MVSEPLDGVSDARLEGESATPFPLSFGPHCKPRGLLGAQGPTRFHGNEVFPFCSTILTQTRLFEKSRNQGVLGSGFPIHLRPFPPLLSTRKLLVADPTVEEEAFPG